MGKIINIALVLILLACLSAQSQPYWEIGKPYIRNYSSMEYDASPQNWDIIQDNRGVIYVGNHAGILEFDGSAWRKIKVPNDSDARSFGMDKNGRIYVGARSEFGYLAPDTAGDMQFKSLIHLLNAKDGASGFTDIWTTVCLGDKVFFQSSNKIFVFSSDSIIQSFSSESDSTRFHIAFDLNSNYYVIQMRMGMLKYVDGDLQTVEGSQVFRNSTLYKVLPLGNDEFLAVSEHDGLFKLTDIPEKQEVYIQRFPSDFDDMKNPPGLYAGMTLGDDKIAIGTRGSGVVIMDYNGKFIKNYNTSNGLIDGYISGLFSDNENNVWCALANGITRIKADHPVTMFTDEHGIQGSIETVSRFNNNLFVGTLSGTYILEQNNQSENKLDGLTGEFNAVSDIAGSTWALKKFNMENDSMLMVLMDNAILQIDNNKKVSTAIPKTIPYCVSQSENSANKMFLGYKKGMACYSYQNNKWEVDFKLDTLPIIWNIMEYPENVLWMGTFKSFLYRLEIKNENGKFEPVSLTRYDTIQGVPYSDILIDKDADGLFLATEKGPYRYNEKMGKFELDPIIYPLLKNRFFNVHRVSQAKAKTWLVTYKDNDFEVGYVDRTKNPYEWVFSPFNVISKDNIVMSVFPENSGVTWFGGPNGLYRYNENVEKDYNKDFNAMIRKVTLNGDSVIFNGTFYDSARYVIADQPIYLAPVLPFRYNSLRFDFSATDYSNETGSSYSWYLEGYDTKWTNWDAEQHYKDYTNLNEGEYFFRVKAINQYGKVSKEAVYQFTILSPWYRTVWAYAGYFISLIVLVWIAVKFSTRKLQAIIKEKTKEIVAQKDEIEAKNINLESANEEILKQKHVIEEKNKDIVDSINYAQRIQQAILPPEEMIKQILPDHFVFFKPKDIVSGDFYWIHEKDGKTFFTAADCTGHGVPGAFMSMIGTSLLNQGISEIDDVTPAILLDAVKAGIIKALKQGPNHKSFDGMDAALCSFDPRNKVLEFSAGNNPLYIVRKGEEPLKDPEGNIVECRIAIDQGDMKLYEIKADKMPIAYFQDAKGDFTNHSFQLIENDAVYVASDGYADQFGGEAGKKFKYKTLKTLLVSLYSQNMHDQGEALTKTILDWMGSEHEQIDDICIIGMRA